MIFDPIRGSLIGAENRPMIDDDDEYVHKHTVVWHEETRQDCCWSSQITLMLNSAVQENYKASLLLSAAADALGYRNGRWRSMTNAVEIHREFDEIEENLFIKPPEWRVSDNTLLHLAVARALIEHGEKNPSSDLYSRVVKHLKSIENDFKTRHPNSNVVSSIDRLTETNFLLSYSSISFDCSAAVRSMCIGLRYPNSSDFDKLFETSIEISRLTHTHVEGYLSGFLSALFTSYAVQRQDVRQWISSMLKIFPKIREKLENEKHFDADRTRRNLSTFEHFWKEFLLRQQTKIDDLSTRDDFYREFSRTGFPAANGNDSIGIALNALIHCEGSWTNLCRRAALHAGRSDASGTIAAAFFGLIYGFDGVPHRYYENVEFHDELTKISQNLFELSHRTTMRMNERGPAVHFQFVPAEILDQMLKFVTY